MRQRFSVLPAIVVYYGLTSIFLFWKIDSLLKDVLVAPLYFVVPTGVGLFLLTLWLCSLPGAAVLVFSRTRRSA